MHRDYNQEYGTNFSTDNFYDYFKDLQKRIKSKGVDLVLVVNMFLTGFDSPRLNTLYVDKNLRYHGLIQAYSRTNRLLNSDKPHGNIVSFRNLKEATDKALALYGDEDAIEVVFKKPYEEQNRDFEAKLKVLREKAPTLEAIDELRSEEEKAAFVTAFRDLLRVKSSLETFAEFSFASLGISEQEFYDQSKYLDIHDERRKRESETESILDEIDFIGNGGSADTFYTVSVTRPAGCFDAYFIGLHGSIEGPDGSGRFPDSPTIVETLNTFDTLAREEGKVIDAELLLYIAPDWNSFLDDLIYEALPYEQAGREELDRHIQAVLRRCPTQSFVLGGYSFGAWIVNDWLSRNSHLWPHILAVTLYGDPLWYHPVPPGDRGGVVRRVPPFGEPGYLREQRARVRSTQRPGAEPLSALGSNLRRRLGWIALF